MLKRFLQWWSESLLNLLPAAWRGVRLPDALLVAPHASGSSNLVEIMQRRRGRIVGRRSVSLDLESGGELKSGTVIISVPLDMVLDRDVMLPLAADQAPDEVLAHQIDRLTPFAPEDIYWGWQRLRREGERIALRLVVIPRARLSSLTGALARSRVTIAGIEVRLGTDAVLRVPLVHASQTRGGGASTRALAALCGVLLVVAIALPFAQQEIAAATIEADIAAVRPLSARAEALRRTLAGGNAGDDAIAADLARSGLPLRALATITRLLPDDSFLTEFTLRPGQVEMRGQSPAAARLIALLAADPMLRNPAFAAPVTRTDSGRMDLFTIRAELVP